MTIACADPQSKIQNPKLINSGARHKNHAPQPTRHEPRLAHPALVVTFFLLLALCVPPVVRAEEDVLIEKNLFSPERKKWIMEDPKVKKPESEQVKKEIADITLFGTVIAGEERYAVLRTKKKAKPDTDSKTPYAVGDYISGFLVAAIEPKRVVLRDEGEGKEYQIFVNDESKDRSVEKTEIKIAEQAGPDNGTVPARRRGRVPPPPKQVDTVDQLKAKVQRSLDILKTNKSDLVRKQAERDLQKLEQMAMGLADNDLQDLARFKQELEKVK